MTMSRHWNILAPSHGRGNSLGWKNTLVAALVVAGILLSPTPTHAQATPKPTPDSTASSVAGAKGGKLYSMSFAGGSIGDLQQLWTRAFTNDNFLVNFSDPSLQLPPFQVRDMTLPELARSIAFLGRGAFAVEVVERNESLPGNIWRVARPSQEALSQNYKMRAIAAPHLFASPDTLERFLGDAERVQRELLEVSYQLRKEEHSSPGFATSIRPIRNQKVFVLIGTEAGISGLESLIQAAEQAAAEPSKESKSGK